MKTRLDSILTVAIILAAPITTAHAATLYSENFDGGVNGQSVTAAPYDFVPIDNGPSTGFVTTTTVFGPDLAFDGRQTDRSGNQAFTTDIPTPVVGDTGYTLSAQAFLTAGTGDGVNGTGTAQANFALRTSGGVFLGFHYNGTQWRLTDFNAFGAGTKNFADGQGEDEIVTLTLTVDMVALTIAGTIDDGVTSESQTLTGFTEAELLTINQIRFGSDYENGGRFSGGLQLDDIQLVGIPEPASMVLLGLGGLCLLGRRR